MPTKPPTPCRRCGAKATYRGLCPTHAGQAQRRQGTTTQRGYDKHHQALRQWWTPQVATGTIPCARCGELIAADESFDLGHQDGTIRTNQSQHSGPEHIACNRATRGR